MWQLAIRLLGLVLIVFGTVMLIKNIHAAQSMPPTPSAADVREIHSP